MWGQSTVFSKIRNNLDLAPFITATFISWHDSTAWMAWVMMARVNLTPSAKNVKALHYVRTYLLWGVRWGRSHMFSTTTLYVALGSGFLLRSTSCTHEVLYSTASAHPCTKGQEGPCESHALLRTLIYLGQLPYFYVVFRVNAREKLVQDVKFAVVMPLYIKYWSCM